MQNISIVESADAPGRVSLEEFCSCIETLTILMNISDKPMPEILVMHVSSAMASRFGVDETGIVRHNRLNSGEPPRYYELWLVGKPELSNYVLALIGILEDHFLLEITSQERERALESAMWAVAADQSQHSLIQ